MSEVQNGSAPVAGNPAPGAGGEGQPWYSGIPDEGLRGYIETKGFKDPGALAESYRNFEKLQGVPQDRILKLPEKADDPGWAGIYSRLGRPEKADGYELKFDGDPAFAQKFQGVFHEANLSKSQAGKLNEAWNSYVNDVIKQDEDARKTKDAAELTELRTKWGATYDANVEAGRRAGREFGLSEEQFTAISGALGSGKTLELFQSIGAKLGEASPFNPASGGSASGFGMTPDQAKGRINMLTGDKDWTGRYLNGGAIEKEEMTRLQKIAAGEA